jgi:hypothetical protein
MKQETMTGHCRREHMVDILLFAMVVASAFSLIVVSPGHERQKTLRALRECDDMKLCVPSEDLQAQGDKTLRRLSD